VRCVDEPNRRRQSPHLGAVEFDNYQWHTRFNEAGPHGRGRRARRRLLIEPGKVWPLQQQRPRGRFSTEPQDVRWKVKEVTNHTKELGTIHSVQRLRTRRLHDSDFNPRHCDAVVEQTAKRARRMQRYIAPTRCKHPSGSVKMIDRVTETRRTEARESQSPVGATEHSLIEPRRIGTSSTPYRWSKASDELWMDVSLGCRPVW
jgi:hypothetical protein